MLLRTPASCCFIDLKDQTGRIQLYLGKKQVGEQNWAVAQCLDLGDIIGGRWRAEAYAKRELTIFVDGLHFLSKALDPPPDKHHGLADLELRQRMRYLDLIHGDGRARTFCGGRKSCNRSARRSRGSGSSKSRGRPCTPSPAARRPGPFVTHHNTLDLKLYLRIALELHLKRMLVGGVERFMSWAACIATRESARGIIPSSQCSKRIRLTAIIAR